MQVDEIKKKREELELAILQLCAQFEKETGVGISEIDFHIVRYIGSRTTNVDSVTIEIML